MRTILPRHAFRACRISVVFGVFLAAGLALPAQQPAALEITPPAILAIMKNVADWQLANASASSNRYGENGWIWGVYNAGMMALAGISDDIRTRDAMLAVGEEFEWRLGSRFYHADDHCIGQTYAELYQLYHEPRMIAPLREQFDAILAKPSATASLAHVNPIAKAEENWSWCDSLFMAPPTWVRLYAVTGDRRYLDFAITNWWRTTDYLYDKDERLFFRDSSYFAKREANGKKVFWGRGNGWVVGGLVRVLQYLPNNHPDRPRFEKLFVDMCEKLLTRQQSDGLWRASLLDPDSYPLKEISGSSFFVYAFAWGVNQKLLDRAKFEPALRKGWAAMAACAQPDGKLTHVQPVGADPRKFDENSSAVYGVGAFLLAGSELYRMAVLEDTLSVSANDRELPPPAGFTLVAVRNPAAFYRDCETVELKFPAPQLNPMPQKLWAVMDGVSSRILDSQEEPIGDGPEHPQVKLLFQVDLAPGETRQFYVLHASPYDSHRHAVVAAVPPPIVKTYARLITERFNDIAWESDRQAHRMYQQALIQGEGTISSGVDAWSKRTRKLIIDKWYKDAHYHEDHGEGLDDYRVGRSRGCGGLGIWNGAKLFVSSNFREGRVLATGPIRSEMELTYDVWDAGGRKVSETKRISIDAGSNMSREESVFSCDDKSQLMVGLGIAQRSTEGIVVEDAAAGLMAYWQPADRDRGNIGCAVVVPVGAIKQFVVEKDSLPALTDAELVKPSNEGLPPASNLLAITQADIDNPFVYYFGSGWSKSADFPNEQAWENYVRQFAARLKEPLQVTSATN